MAATYSELDIGSSYSTRRTITSEQVRQFGALLHPERTAEYERISHTLLLGYVSKILGCDFPGPGTVAVAMSTNFLHRPSIDTEIEFTVTIIEKHEARGHVKGRVEVTGRNQDILRGEAVLIPPSTGAN